MPSKKALPWQAASLVALALLGGVYMGHTRWVREPHGGSLLGILLGILATALILLLVALGMRKRAYKSTLGTLEGWVQAHIYLGLLTVPVVLMHAGFRFHDKIATATFLVMTVVVLSGVVGAAFYTALPRRLTALRTVDTAAELSEELNRLARTMAKLAHDRSVAFRGIYRKLESEADPGSAAGWRLVLLGAGQRPGEAGETDLGPLLSLVESSERDALRRLLVLARQRRELHQRLRFRQRYKNLLELWLYVHVPLTAVLLALLAVHVVAALWFRGL